jgi:hypothetical protein
MNSIAQKFNSWTQRTCDRNTLKHFQIAFASVWLLYDILDLLLGGTESVLWLMPENSLRQVLKTLQCVLIISQINIVFGIQTKVFTLALFLARACEGFLFPINDFFYGAITALILIPAQWGEASEDGQVPAWPRDLLILQTAWIYFATAILKLGPSFISGGDLYVRQNYLSKFLNWPFPAFYLKWISSLPANAVLSWAAISLELLLSVSLFVWWKKKKLRKNLRPLLVALVIAIHGFAASTTNVFFFGFSMIAQVFLLTR